MVTMVSTPGGLSPFPRTGGFLAAAVSLTDPAVSPDRAGPSSGPHGSTGAEPAVTARELPAYGVRPGLNRPGRMPNALVVAGRGAEQQ
jgi:hypothetical protein